MIWAILTLLAVLLWASTNLLDRYVALRTDPMVCTLIACFMGLLFASPILLLGFPLDMRILIPSILAGLFYFLLLLTYFKSLRAEEVSRVIPLFELKTIFTLLIAAFWLGEVLKIEQYIGAIMIVLGSIALELKGLKLSRVFFLMLLSSLCVSAHEVLSKYILSYVDFWKAFAMIRLWSFIFCLVLIPFIIGRKVRRPFLLSLSEGMTCLVFFASPRPYPMGLFHLLAA